MASRQHEHPVSAAEFTNDLAHDGVYIAAIASYSPDPNKVNRYTLYREQAERIEWCADAWLTVAEAEKLATMANIRVGESDAMYMLGPIVVWYRHGDTLKIFSEDKLIFSLNGQEIVLHGNAINRAEIRSVHAYLDRGWVECGLRLVLPKEEILIAYQVNEIASMDITYDGLNLLCDTWWAVALGRLLSEALAVPYVPDEDLA